MEIKLKRLHKDAQIPTYGTKLSACLDLYAVNSVLFRPGDVKYISCGWAFEIPAGYNVKIYPRSSIACKKQLVILNSPAVIDSDYRGEVFTYMKNVGNEIITINKGDRYAQMELTQSIFTFFNEVSQLSNTERSDGGFGSTGK